jgi:hypothetical protein
MKTAEATWRTENAQKYLQQLCKHFGHKIEATFKPEEGRIEFPFGPVDLRANDNELWIQVTAEDDEAIERGKDVIDRHLERFAFREEFKHMPWAA